MSDEILLTCLNCQTDTSDPYILECFHALCKDCARKLTRSEYIII